MSSSRWLQAPLAIGFVLLLAIAGSSVWLYVAADQLNRATAHSLEVRAAANQLLVMVQDAETGQRGFLLTRNSNYLEPYRTGADAAPRALASLRAAVARDAQQAAAGARLQELVDAKLRELASTLVPAERGDFTAALAIVNNNNGNTFMGEIRDAVRAIETAEDRSQRAIAARTRTTNISLAVATTAAIATVIALAVYAIRSARRATDDLLRAQSDLAEVNRNLEGIVEARVGDLKLANEEIQRFAYIVSHDLRAPLVNVLGFTSELDALRGEMQAFVREVEGVAPALVTAQRRELVEADLPEALGFIRTSTNKMDRLINAILQLSREGRRTLKPEKIALAALVEAQGGTLAQQLAAKDAEIMVEDRLPDLVSDRLAVEQIFGNLIDNAVKYLAAGRAGRVMVRGRSEGRLNHYEVADNGRGIAAKDKERIFELFRRSGEQDTQGEGIGLAYVRNLVRRLGGTIVVDSELGVGSTFTVTLPAAFTMASTPDF